VRCEYPEVFVSDTGKNGVRAFYDVAGSRTRGFMHLKRPEAGPDKPQMIRLPGQCPLTPREEAFHSLIRNLLKTDGPGLTAEQGMWLANAPFEWLEPLTKDVYQWLSDTGHRAWIPIDSWNFVMGEGR